MSLEATYTPARKGTPPAEPATDYTPTKRIKTPSEKVHGWNCGFVERAQERARQRAQYGD